MGRLACDSSWNGSPSLALASRRNLVAGLKCSPTPSWVNVKRHSQMDSILDVLSVHREHKEAAQMVKQRLCSYIWDERGRGRWKKRDRMQFQPLSSAAWLVAIATWLRIPFHLPFLINSHSSPLPRQPSFVLKCLTTAAGLPPLF